MLNDEKIEEILSLQGPRFFGEITASISHEIKNSLAIVNENAGLLEDLIVMQEKMGKPLNIERVKKISQDLQNQIDRADGIIKNLNRFAHSVDKTEDLVEVNSVLDYLFVISDRLLKRKGIKRYFEKTEQEIESKVNLFYFLNLIWAIILLLYWKIENEGEITLKTEVKDGENLVIFRAPESLDIKSEVAEDERVDYLTNLLSVKVKVLESNILALVV